MAIDPNLKHFRSQRAQAAVRGIPWRLEFWEWLQIWEDSGHLHERGTRKGQWVMARPRDVGPYSADNVRIVRCEKNNSEAARGRVEERRRAREAPIENVGPSTR